jgi:hypothetical protein
MELLSEVGRGKVATSTQDKVAVADGLVIQNSLNLRTKVLSESITNPNHIT